MAPLTPSHLLSAFALVTLLCSSPGLLVSDSKPSPSLCALGPGLDSHQIVNTSKELWPYQTFKSSSFNPPEFKITHNGKPLAPGSIFITPSDGAAFSAAKDVAPIILTDAGQLVWNGPQLNATNFRVTKFEGNPILTYWSGLSTAGANIGHGYGNVTFLDSSYNEILTVCPNFGLVIPGNETFSCQADLHESFVTDRNTIIVSAYNATPTDLSSVKGPSDGWVFDCLFFEIEPRSGNILFHWSALEHVPVTDSKQPLGTSGTKTAPYDFFHINSVVNIGNQFLVNGRHVWSTYLVKSTGEIGWTIQGETGGDFGTLPANGHFRWQHHARPHVITDDSITISWFNNYNSATDNGTHSSDGLELHLKLPPNKATAPTVLEYFSDPKNPLYADSQGSHQILSNGNSLLDYGQLAVLKEFGPGDPAGSDVRWSAQFGGENVVQSYRGFKYEWHGYPTTAPSLVLEDSSDIKGCRTGYVSWNGATDIEAWVIFVGESGKPLKRVGQVTFAGFETKFTVDGDCVRVTPVVHGNPEEGSSSSVVC